MVSPFINLLDAGNRSERSPRPVTIYLLEAVAIRGRDVDLRVICSKGTYIRTLCVDIGDRLQVGGHLFSLERSRVGPFHVQDALNLQDVKSAPLFYGNCQAFLTIDQALEQFPAVTVKPECVTKVINGAPIPWGAVEVSEGNFLTLKTHHQSHIRIRDSQGQLLALGRGSTSDINDEPMLCIENVLIEK